MDYIFIPNTNTQMNIFSKFIPLLGIDNVLIVDSDDIKKGVIRKELKDYKGEIVKINNINEKIVQEILSKYKPKVIVVGNDLEVVSNLFVKVAKNNNIKTVLIQDGAICTYKNIEKMNINYLKNYLFEINFNYLINRISSKLSGNNKRESLNYKYGSNVDYLLVWGEFTKRQLEKIGIGGKIIVTGSPKFDFINKLDVNKNLEIDYEKPIIIYAPTDCVSARIFDLNEFRKITELVVNAAKENNLQMIIKPHPRFKLREKDFFKNYLSENIIEVNDIDILELISFSNILITDLSTTALEACIMKKPSVIVNTTGKKYSEPYPGEYVRKGIAKQVKNEIELEQAINDYLYNNEEKNIFLNNRKKFLDEQIYKLDGKSAERIANFLLNLKES